jgi:hypothetical protein
MCLRSEGVSAPNPTDPDQATPQKAPTREPSIPVKEPVEPDRRQSAERPMA